MAKALAAGLSLEGGGEALSIGAAGLFLRSLGGNPMDVHLHTSVNLRRYLLRLDGISLKNKLMLLLTWQSGPEIRSTATRMEPYPQPDMEAVAALPTPTTIPSSAARLPYRSDHDRGQRNAAAISRARRKCGPGSI